MSLLTAFDQTGALHASEVRQVRASAAAHAWVWVRVNRSGAGCAHARAVPFTSIERDSVLALA